MTNYDYRMANGYEVHPEDISDKLLKVANMDLTQEEEEIAIEQLTEALYHLDAICQNRYNDDKFRTLYNVLAYIADDYI